MDENRIEGVVREGIGRVQDAYGGGVGDLGVQARGKLNEAAGEAQNLYGRALDQARDIADEAAELIRDQPYAAAGVAALVGLVVGLLLGGSGNEKIVYVRR
jgi:ElaB/YqjD/DUF883 family membrane-anchored ribosome-binding protein